MAMVFLLPLSLQTLIYAIGFTTLCLMYNLISTLWLSPRRTRSVLERNGFTGPSPQFPFGNLLEMRKKHATSMASMALSGDQPPSGITHDIHASVFPHFARWRKSFGNVFIYWLGTEPFLYTADPEFLKQVTSGILGKQWGKPDVFKRDRKPMFGDGLLMVEGNDWTFHRHIISPAFSMTNLNSMIGIMEETTKKMVSRWTALINSGQREINIETDITENAAEIIAKASFGINEENCKIICEKLRLMQAMLFKSNRLVGVPFSKFLHLKQSYNEWKLGKEVDRLLLQVIESRRQGRSNAGRKQNDLLGHLLAENDDKATQQKRLTTKELVDECKTFFFGGHESSALALSWSLLLLAVYPEWQSILRDEIMAATDDHQNGELTSDVLSRLTKMGWVLNEVLRLYSPAPNLQRQAREDIRINGDSRSPKVIPRGTNMWIDVVAMHHDAALWGPDVLQFRPERFAESAHGGCRHRMGFLPFGFGGRICIGRNLLATEYKVVLSLVLREFRLSVSPAYRHEPRTMLSLRPSHGIQLELAPL